MWALLVYYMYMYITARTNLHQCPLDETPVCILLGDLVMFASTGPMCFICREGTVVYNVREYIRGYYLVLRSPCKPNMITSFMDLIMSHMSVHGYYRQYFIHPYAAFC